LSYAYVDIERAANDVPYCISRSAAPGAAGRASITSNVVARLPPRARRAPTPALARASREQRR
jgi:hypothetical protein